VPSPDRTRDLTHSRDADRALDATTARAPRVASRQMRRSARLALALSVCALGAPALAAGQAAAPGTPDAGATTPAAATPSPFERDRAASQPFGLLPDTVAKAIEYPEQPIVLTWAEVPNAVGYEVEVSGNPGFSSIAWESEVVQPIAVPDKLLPDGEYWWRVKAVDTAGTVGLSSDVARFSKTWPSQVTGTTLAGSPGGPAVSHVTLNPYMTWNAVPGAQTYDVEAAAGDQFATWSFLGKNIHSPFASPALAGALTDDTYNWRVRAKDPEGNLGPWTVGSTFTKAWVAPVPVSPADGATSHDLTLKWQPVEGAERYQVQISDMRHNFQGTHLKVDAMTSGSAFTPTLAEQQSKNLTHGDVYWRVRPVLDGAVGTWSPQMHLDWQPVGATTPAAVLSSSGDSDTGLSPQLSWSRVAGATLYRVDIAADPQFNSIFESEFTTSTGWTSRNPLRDNQVGTGYYWRVVWGSGITEETPDWMVDEATVDSAQYRKQTRITLGSAAGGQLVSSAPLLTWSAVPGVGKYEVQLSPDGKFSSNESTRSAIVYGLGAVAGSMKEGEKRLPDGTWSWRVRAVDGGDQGQTWSPVGTFTLTQPRPDQELPKDGATVVNTPLLTWGPVPGACSYDVQVARDPAFQKAAATDKGMSTAQTALVPPKGVVANPGKHYWRVRANYCGESGAGAWSPTRSFRSVVPPDFNLNSIPNRVDYRKLVLVAGQLRHNGAVVKRGRLFLERRLWPSDRFRPAGTVLTNQAGGFRFALRMTRSANYRLVWRETATNPEASTAFGIGVQPRVTFRLASSRVARKQRLLVKGSVYPRRAALVQLKTSDGWQTIRRIKAGKARFSVGVSTHKLQPGTQRLRLFVPRDKGRRFANASSRQRGVLVYDRFVIR
jgi:hypothetical protein